MDALIRSGVPFELAGLVYFGFYLIMSRPHAGRRFSQRSKILTLLAAIVLVASVPLRYGANPLAIVAMFGFAGLAMLSTILDRRSRD